MARINFTQDHMTRLQELALEMLMTNLTVKGPLGTIFNIHQLLHETTTNTLQTMYANIKKEIEKINNLDTWSQTDYQQQKVKSLTAVSELINLIIGYKKYQVQLNNEKAEIDSLKAELKELKKQNMSPEEQIKAIEQKIMAMGGTVEVESPAGVSEESKTEDTTAAQ